MRSALLKSPGVTDVNVDFASQTATCTITDEFNADEAIAVLADAGYGKSQLKQ